MTRAARLLFVVTFLFTLSLQAQTPSIEYTIAMPKPWTHLFEIELTLRGLPASPSTVDFVLPIWRTGRYVVFDFAGGVQEVSALDGAGGALAWEKTDKSTWQVKKGRQNAVTIRYKVYANEFEQRTRGLDEDHAFIDACAVLMYVEQYRHLPHLVNVVPYKDWHVTSGLDFVAGSTTKLRAPSYDVLADSPIEIGHQKDFEFDVDGKKHILMIYGEAPYDAEQMKKDLAILVKANKEFWGDLPYQKYVFMLHITPQGGGGTEHLNSTIMQTRPGTFKSPRGYQGFLSLVSHEYFHTWNVKQLRPKAYVPYDFLHEGYSKELWIAEGSTSYFDQLILVKAGLTPASGTLSGIAGLVQGDRQRPGNRIQSLSESGFDAWVKFWKGGQQSYNAESDYYGKGAMVSFLLDLEIRHRSQNKHSYADVMRELYHRFPVNKKGFTIDDVQKISEELAGSSLKTFFDNYIHGTTPIDWESSLLTAGLVLKAKAPDGKPWLGAQTSDQNGRLVIRLVIPESPASEAHMDIGDEIIALNGQRVRSTEFQDRLAEFKPGEVVKFTVFRDDRLREFPVTLRNPEVPSYTVTKVDEPTPLQKSIFESMMHTTW